MLNQLGPLFRNVQNARHGGGNAFVQWVTRTARTDLLGARGEYRGRCEGLPTGASSVDDASLPADDQTSMITLPLGG